MRNGFNEQQRNSIPIVMNTWFIRNQGEDDEVVLPDAYHFRMTNVEGAAAGHMNAKWAKWFGS